MALEKCSAADLKKVGWPDQRAANMALGEFTGLVFEEAQNEQAGVKEKIKCDPNARLQKRETELFENWKSRGRHEDTRPWIIEMQILTEGDYTYTLRIVGRRVGEQEASYMKSYNTHEPGPFGTVIQQRHYPAVAKRVAEIGCDILHGCEERER